MKWGVGGRSYFGGRASVLGRVVGGDVRGRDSKGRSGAHFSSANTHTGVWRTQGGKLLFLAKTKRKKERGGREKRGKKGHKERLKDRRWMKKRIEERMKTKGQNGAKNHSKKTEGDRKEEKEKERWTNMVKRDGKSSGKGKKRRMSYTAEVWDTSIKMLQKGEIKSHVKRERNRREREKREG